MYLLRYLHDGDAGGKADKMRSESFSGKRRGSGTLIRWAWILAFFAWSSACVGASNGGEVSPGGKVFLALGICLAAVFLVFFIVAKGREKN